MKHFVIDGNKGKFYRKTRCSRNAACVDATRYQAALPSKRCWGTHSMCGPGVMVSEWMARKCQGIYSNLLMIAMLFLALQTWPEQKSDNFLTIQVFIWNSVHTIWHGFFSAKPCCFFIALSVSLSNSICSIFMPSVTWSRPPSLFETYTSIIEQKEAQLYFWT